MELEPSQNEESKHCVPHAEKRLLGRVSVMGCAFSVVKASKILQGSVLAVILALSSKTVQSGSLQKDLGWPGYATSKSGQPPDFWDDKFAHWLQEGLTKRGNGRTMKQASKAHVHHYRVMKAMSEYNLN